LFLSPLKIDTGDIRFQLCLGGSLQSRAVVTLAGGKVSCPISD
jgi:hypothetical protein